MSVLHAFRLTGSPHHYDVLQNGNYEYTSDGYLRYVLAVVRQVRQDDTCLMLKSLKHGGKFQCPGGKIDHGESAEQALEREILEELGCGISTMQPLFNRRVYAGSTLWQGEYFACSLAGSPRIMERHKHSQLCWVRRLPQPADANGPGFTLEAREAHDTAPGMASKPPELIIKPHEIHETYDACALHSFTSGCQQESCLHYLSDNPDSLQDLSTSSCNEWQGSIRFMAPASLRFPLPANAHVPHMQQIRSLAPGTLRFMHLEGPVVLPRAPWE